MKDFRFRKQTLLECRPRGPDVRSFEVQLLGFRRFLSSKPKPNSAGSGCSLEGSGKIVSFKYGGCHSNGILGGGCLIIDC